MGVALRHRSFPGGPGMSMETGKPTKVVRSDDTYHTYINYIHIYIYMYTCMCIYIYIFVLSISWALPKLVHSGFRES